MNLRAGLYFMTYLILSLFGCLSAVGRMPGDDRCFVNSVLIWLSVCHMPGNDRCFANSVLVWFVCLLWSLIVIFHNLLESPHTTKCYQLMVCRVLTIKKQ